MSRPNAVLPLGFGCILAGAMLGAGVVSAQTTNGLNASISEVPRFTSTVYPGELVGREQILRQVIRSGTNEFVFILPDGLGIQTASDGTIALTSPDQSYFVTIRIAGAPPLNSGIREALQERIASQYGGVTNSEEFATMVADREGTGFALEQELPKVGTRLIRIVWVPFKAGLFEFALNADKRRAADAQGALDMILLTFRSNERGKIEIVKRSEKS
jgi:hypothetical protein